MAHAPHAPRRSKDSLSYKPDQPPLVRWQPLSEAQAAVQRAYKDNDVVVITGGAGSGKTITAVGLALLDVFSSNSRRDRVVALRPAVVADEPLGFLKGTLSQKLAPFAEPIRQASEKVAFNLPPGALQVESLGHLRGVTLDDCVVIVDEAQNCSMRQLVLALTRLGKGSKIVFTGDPEQSDLAPFTQVIRAEATNLHRFSCALEGTRGFSWCRLPEGECHRHPAVARCLESLRANLNPAPR